MLKRPKLQGPNQLRIFVEELGAAAACEAIDVHPATLRKWLRGAAPVPQAALQALYWLTSYGFSDAAAEVHWSHQMLVMKVRELQAIAEWAAPTGWRAGNEPAYHSHGLVIPLSQDAP